MDEMKESALISHEHHPPERTMAKSQSAAMCLPCQTLRYHLENVLC